MTYISCPRCRSHTDWFGTMIATAAVVPCEIALVGEGEGSIEITAEHVDFNALDVRTEKYTCAKCGFSISADRLDEIVLRPQPQRDAVIVKRGTVNGFEPFRERVAGEDEVEYNALKARYNETMLEQQKRDREEFGVHLDPLDKARSVWTG